MNQVITLGTETTTLVLNGRVISSFVAGEIITLTPDAEQTSHVNGSNGGVSISQRADASVYTMVVNVLKYSEDDVYLNEQVNAPIPVIFNGSLKQDFSRDGQGFKESWSLENGSITAKPAQTYNDLDGNALMAYTIKFRTAKRIL